MKLTHYDITYTVSDPDDPETSISAKLSRCDRDKVVARGGLLADMIATLEESIVEEGDDDDHEQHTRTVEV
jgi:hypothetical protein